MKLKKRNTHRRVLAWRITSPETRPNPTTGKKQLLLSFVDEQGNHNHMPVTKELFLYAAGENEEGQLPDGLDRLQNHKFIIHKDINNQAIGIDIIPSRVYRSQVIPASQRDVTTVRFEWLLNGAVCRVTQRPPNTKAERIIEVIRELDALITAGKDINGSTKIGNIGKVTLVEDDAIEVKLANRKTTAVPAGYALDVDAED
jgi:hypothetical protein